MSQFRDLALEILMSPASLVIDRRFCGPPNSGNGGYTCGRLAAFIDGPAEVTLRSPPPLDEALSIERAPDSSVRLRSARNGQFIGEARPVSFEPVDIQPVSAVLAAEAASRTFPPGSHPLPGCFVCGPARDVGDGLRIHAGPVGTADPDWTGPVAAPWVPDQSLTDEDGIVRIEFLWAALDCPTAFAVSSGSGMRIILLGRQAVRVHARPAGGDACVVVAHRRGREGRKFFADAALFADDGSLLAECHALWIEVSRDVQRGAQRKSAT